MCFGGFRGQGVQSFAGLTNQMFRVTVSCFGASSGLVGILEPQVLTQGSRIFVGEALPM